MPGSTETLDPPAVPPPSGRGTLARQLVLRVVALVALIAVSLSLFTALATRALLMGQLDQQLVDAKGRAMRGGGPESGSSPDASPSGQAVGTLILVSVQGTSPKAIVLTDDGHRARPSWTLTTDATAEQLLRSSGTPKPVVIDLNELGRYRFVSWMTPDGSVTYGIGLPLVDVDAALANLIAVEIVLSIVAVGAAAVIGRTLVERSLRPLNRVAATAQQVSRLPLDRGEVALAVRVPPADTNPDSEVGRVGLALNHMLENVEEALAARQASETKVRQFVADASHELRNPLAAIRGYAELTQRSGEAIPPDAAYAMSRVESEAERMSRLVEDLLLLARLDAGPALDIRPTDLNALLIDAVSDARAAGPDHSWSLALPGELVTVPADQYRLHQVVANLLANARTHTPAGTRVEARLTTAGDRAVLTVTDDGPGIAPEIVDRVFERFTRADTSRVRAAGAAKGASTGLGLAIVAAVVEAHHGTVSVQSRPGETRFVVGLPLDRATAPIPDLDQDASSQDPGPQDPYAQTPGAQGLRTQDPARQDSQIS
jgi:two-component system OmpR family sensor kinase